MFSIETNQEIVMLNYWLSLTEKIVCNLKPWPGSPDLKSWQKCTSLFHIYSKANSNETARKFTVTRSSSFLLLNSLWFPKNVSLILLKYTESHPVKVTQGHLLNKSNVMRYSLSEITYLKINTMPGSKWIKVDVILKSMQYIW